MSEPSPQAIRQIFDAASSLPPDQRAAFLATRCADNSALRAEVESLLAASERLGDFLAGPTMNSRGDVQTGSAPDALPRQIGPYKILQVIGEGGFGVVYLAEQQEPVRRRVALKVIKSGMDTSRVIARFEAERQALAIMDHPNIARVFEAGATEAGRPYFAMELVGGVPITTYCDEKRLTARQRLELFAPVCQAVQHAHQKGVIHRDIKPTNVLVAEHDGRAVPKVIDFGIAKAIDAPLTEKTLFTEFRQFMGTPEYMSPEQAQIGGIDVDTRSDVYSLGVLLYELLTGATPFDPRELRSKAFEEMQRIIREVDPPRPSTRLSTVGNAASVAALRSTEPRRLTTLIRGELDWVVMKCLEKDRSRRYESAAALAADVLHYLAGEPVTASPAGSGYLARKFIRKHRWGILVGSAIVLALAIGLVAALLAERDARRALALARQRQEQLETANQTTEAVNAFLNQMLQSADPLRGAGKDITVVKVLDQAAGAVESRLSERPLVQAAIRKTIGMTYQNLGHTDAAIPHLKGAYETRRQLLGADAKDTIISENDYAMAVADSGDLKLAEQLERDSVDRSIRIWGAGSVETFSPRENLGVLLIDTGRLPEGSAILNDVYDQAKRVCKAEDLELPNACANAAYAAYRAGRYTDAADLYQRSADDYARIKGPDYGTTPEVRQKLASALIAGGEPVRAEAVLRDNLARQKRVLGDDHPNTLYTMNALATALSQQRKLDESEAITRDLLDRMKRVNGPDSIESITLQGNLGYLLSEQKKLDQAEPILREALAHARRVLGEKHLLAARDLMNLGGALRQLGKLPESEANFREAMEIFDKASGGKSPDALNAMANLGLTLEAMGRFQEAETIYGQVYDAAQAAQIGKARAALDMSFLGPCRVKLKNYTAAEAPLREALRRLLDANLTKDPRTREVYSALIEVCVNLGKTEEAAKLRTAMDSLPASSQPTTHAAGN